MVSSSKSSSNKTVSAESSTNPSPGIQAGLRRLRAQSNRLERARNKATSALRRPLIISNHPQPSHIYSCNLCPERFSTYQALGGHQNAHRRERLLQKCLMVMEYQEHMAENDINLIHHHRNPSNSSTSPNNIVYSANPIRVAYPLTDFQKVNLPYHHHQIQSSFGLKMGLRPTLDAPSPSWLAHLLHHRHHHPPPAAATTPAPLAPTYGLPPPGWTSYHRPSLDLSAQPTRPIIHDFGVHGHAEPSFPPGFGGHYERGSSSSASIKADQKGKAVVEDAPEEDDKESWGRDLKLWP